MPAGLLVTEPLPEPDLVIERRYPEGRKLAVTAFAASMVTTHVEVPAQAPDQPANSEPLSAVAVKVTVLPVGKSALHADPQTMPDGLLTTCPAPAPVFDTVSGWPRRVKAADTYV
jgi:hypothetical protein